ncbi:MAG: cyclic nucleotide-binding domain-containing protein [Oligoflexales bacterium]
MDQDITIGAGQTLFRQGEKGGDLYFIKAGEVELSVRDEETGKEAIVAICGPKSVIGTMSFLEDEPRSASAKVKSEIKCTKISQLQRDRMMKTIPNWFRILVKDLSGNIRRTNKIFIKLNAEIDLLKKKVGARDKQKSKLEADLEISRTQAEDIGAKAKKKEESMLEEIKSLQKKVVNLQAELANPKNS